MKRATLALVAAFAIVATAETSRTATENWTRNRIAEATNGLRRVDAEACPLPAYLHAYQFADAYPEDAAWYYQFADMGGACSSVRNGNDYARNFDLTYDERAEFVVEMIAGPGRLASVGVANVGTNLTEAAVTSGARSRFYKALPGATVDGINSEGVVCSINLVPTNGAPWETKGGRDLNAIGVVRFVLDTATSASNAAAAVASRCYIPDALKRKGYSAHFMLADERETWIVEDGTAHPATGRAVLTNYRLFADNDPYGTGYERFNILAAGGNITSAWFRAAYRRPFSRPTEFAAPGVGTHSETDALLAWAEANIPQGAPESLTRNGHSWQTVHTSRFDISNRVLRVAVQERPDWYVFAVPSSGGVKPEAVREIVKPMIGAAADALDAAKRDKGDRVAWTFTGDTQGYENLWIGVEYNSEIGVYDYSLYDGGKRIYTTPYPTRQQEVYFNFLDDEGSVRSITAKEDSIALESQLAGKVDAVAGKGLSKNDYTNADKAEVAKVKDKADEFTAWEFRGEVESGHSYAVEQDIIDETYCDFVLKKDGNWFDSLDGQRRDSLTVNFFDFAHITATRKRVLRTGDAATPEQVDAKITAAGHMTRTEADAAYYPKDQGQAWSTYWDGDDVRVTVTNYDSVAHLPSLYLEQRTNETAMATNLFRVVWREMAHWEKFLGSGWDWDGQWQGFKAWAAGIVAQIEEKADRAWGFFDSHTGQYAPDGYTSISSEHIMLCKGASYQKTVTTRGDVWVLTADEPYEPTGVSTNGGFQLKDGDGNVQFEIVKGDKVTFKAQANRMTVEDGTTLVVVYNVIVPEHPAGETCLALETAEWKKEDAADCPATVVWSGSSGNWVARITPKSGLATGRCFFKATYQRGGDTYINNKCAVGMSQIVLGGVTYNLGTATISGHTVLTLTPAN